MNKKRIRGSYFAISVFGGIIIGAVIDKVDIGLGVGILGGLLLEYKHSKKVNNEK